MNDPKCPFCSKKQLQEAIKSWQYGNAIISKTTEGTKWGHAITCSRYNCNCGKLFNFYHSVKGKTWTIPKSKSKKD